MRMFPYSLKWYTSLFSSFVHMILLIDETIEKGTNREKTIWQAVSTTPWLLAAVILTNYIYFHMVCFCAVMQKCWSISTEAFVGFALRNSGYWRNVKHFNDSVHVEYVQYSLHNVTAFISLYNSLNLLVLLQQADLLISDFCGNLQANQRKTEERKCEND